VVAGEGLLAVFDTLVLEAFVVDLITHVSGPRVSRSPASPSPRLVLTLQKTLVVYKDTTQGSLCSVR